MRTGTPSIFATLSIAGEGSGEGCSSFTVAMFPAHTVTVDAHGFLDRLLEGTLVLVHMASASLTVQPA